MGEYKGYMSLHVTINAGQAKRNITEKHVRIALPLQTHGTWSVPFVSVLV